MLHATPSAVDKWDNEEEEQSIGEASPDAMSGPRHNKSRQSEALANRYAE